MGKYEVLTLLSPSQGDYILPGEVIQLDDETAAILMEKGAVRPALFSEVNNGTDDRTD